MWFKCSTENHTKCIQRIVGCQFDDFAVALFNNYVAWMGYIASRSLRISSLGCFPNTHISFVIFTKWLRVNLEQICGIYCRHITTIWKCSLSMCY